MRELEFIDWIRSQSGFDATRVPVGPGDDCAIVNFLERDMLVTTDQVLDGVHVRIDQSGARAAGRKALARNLSDIAAMAAKPVACVATVASPSDFTADQAQELYAGLRDIGDAFDCPLVGGDVATWQHPTCISVTVFGSAIDGVKPVLRSGAKPGDALCVTGSLGASWRTERHLQFTPRIKEAASLARQINLHAMIDLSDGLATDLRHIAKASGVGAEISVADIPIHDDAIRICDSRNAALSAALCDGEDYELLFTISQDDAKRIGTVLPDLNVTRIGTVVEGSELTLIHPDDSREPLSERGWEHGRE